jgi:hypothetical protein
MILLFFASIQCQGQPIDSLQQNLQTIPDQFYSKVQKKYAGIDQSLFTDEPNEQLKDYNVWRRSALRRTTQKYKIDKRLNRIYVKSKIYLT